MKKLNLKKNKKGFTLVEIIVVLVIIGILMALAVPATMKYINDASETKVMSQVRAGFIAAQSSSVSEIAKEPGITDDELTAKITKTRVNDELGLKEGVSGAVNTITCVISSQKIDTCAIKVVGSETEYTASQTQIVKTSDLKTVE